MIDELIRAKPSAAKGRYIRSVTFATTMGPGVKVEPTRVRDTRGVGRSVDSIATRTTPQTSGRVSVRPEQAEPRYESTLVLDARHRAGVFRERKLKAR